MNGAERALLRRVTPRRGLSVVRSGWPSIGLRHAINGLSKRGLIDWSMTFYHRNRTDLQRVKAGKRKYRR